MEECKCSRSLRNMEVINICDGKRCGFVSDVSIDTCCGRCTALCVLLDDGKCLSICKPEHIYVPWDAIERIGTDVILVSLPPECRSACDGDNRRKKLF